MSTLPWQQILLAWRGNGLRARLIKGGVGVWGLSISSLALGLATSILLARTLGPEGFGQYSFIMSVIMVLSLPFGEGLQSLVTREVAGFHNEGNWALLRGLLRRAQQGTALGVAVVGTVFGSIAAFRATWTPNDFWTLLLAGLVLLPFLGLIGLRLAILRGFGYVVKAQLPEYLARPGFHLALASLLVACGWLNPATALLSQAAAGALGLAVATILLRRCRPAEVGPSEPAYRTQAWVNSWVPLTLVTAASLLNNQIGILLLGWLGTDEQVAALRVADYGAQLVALSLGIVNLVIAPHITRTYRDGDWLKLQELSRQSARVAFVVAMPIALVFILFGSPIVERVFGTDYVELTSTPLAILAAAQLVNVAFGSLGMFLTMSGFERDTLCGQVIALSINGVAGLVLIPGLGAEGAAYAAALGLISWNLILAARFVRRLQLRPTAF